MRCFAHQKSMAVCACSYCLKGLCQECMQEVAGKFACSTECSMEIQKIKAVNNCAFEIYGIDKTGQRKKRVIGSSIAKLYLGLGIPFLGFGVYSAFNIGDWGLTSFASIFGLVCIAYAWRIYKRGYKI